MTEEQKSWVIEVAIDSELAEKITGEKERGFYVSVMSTSFPGVAAEVATQLVSMLLASKTADGAKPALPIPGLKITQSKTIDSTTLSTPPQE